MHIRDIVELSTKQPSVHEEFVKRNFTAQKTFHAFSLTALNQANGQNNKVVKGNGGAIGLMQYPLFRWMVGEPQLARLVIEFEECRDESMHSQANAGNGKLYHE